MKTSSLISHHERPCGMITIAPDFEIRKIRADQEKALERENRNRKIKEEAKRAIKERKAELKQRRAKEYKKQEARKQPLRIENIKLFKTALAVNSYRLEFALKGESYSFAEFLKIANISRGSYIYYLDKRAESFTINDTDVSIKRIPLINKRFTIYAKDGTIYKGKDQKETRDITGICTLYYIKKVINMQNGKYKDFIIKEEHETN